MADSDDFGAFLIGLVIGGLTGAVVALLFAPQSGEETRTLIKEKGIELRDQATKQAEAVASKAGQITSDAKVHSKDLVDSAKKAVAKKRPADTTG
jgi:gas vesicle protein